MTDTRAPRPTDLVALVTFDEEVRENLAITRDHLGVANEPPRPLAAAIEQWLHLGRRMWISMAGREIRGIATARELSRTAWELDTLIDAPEGGEEVIADLLRQAARAAREGLVTRVLLRTPVGSAAAETAPRAGFRQVVEETLWIGHPAGAVGADAGQPAEDREGDTDRLGASDALGVREATTADLQARFQLYCRAYSMTAREALAMTQGEWQDVQDTRWVDRGSPPILVAESGGRVRAALQASSSGQFSLLAEPEAVNAGEVLIQELRRRLPSSGDVYGLVVSGSAAEQAARRAGLQPAGEYELFCLRVSRPIREEAREAATARAGIAIPGR